MATASTDSHSSHLLVAAFDFGTTYSGYAFSFRDKPLDVITNQSWIAGSEKLISLKTPTCILLEQNGDFHSFGFEAENKFTTLAEDDLHHGWMLFRRFKMLLHNNQNLSRDTYIEDISGKSMKAMPIFAMAIRYLQKHLMTTLNNQTTGIKETDIQYVITVPAIWDDNAKQFMREAAIEAGIDTKRLKMALEPEAASVWCQQITAEAKLALSAAGTQYMVVDLGGGTADISVHEKLIDGKLKELHKASGGAWGGNEVDKNYISTLTEIFGVKVIERFKKEQIADYFDILREFETKKRTITSTTDGKITFRVSATLKEIFEEGGQKVKDAVSRSDYGNLITMTGDKFRVDASVVRQWFDAPINSLIVHVKDIFQEPKMEDVKVIVLVGGFGESQLVQQEFRKRIQNKRLIIPNDAGLVVLKGAVRFGHLPDIVSSRIMKFSYGISVANKFDPAIHCATKKVVFNEQEKCDQIFSAFVWAGNEILTGHKVIKNYTPNFLDKTSLRFYISPSSVKPMYVTDEGCTKHGILLIPHEEGQTLEDKDMTIEFLFGDTEISVKVTLDKTGKEFYYSIDCL